MTKSLFRALLAVAGAVFLGLTTLPAAAATLTYNDPNCAGFQITGPRGNSTLTCGKLACAISGVTNPTTAQDTALTATCTPSGASFLWSLVTGPSSDPSCNSPSSPTAATTAIVKPGGIAAGQSRSCLYQVTGTAAPLSGQATVAVTWRDAPASPPVCTPSGVTAPTPITSAGGTITLNANCAPSVGVTYTWTRTAPTAGAPANPTSAAATDSLAANTGASGVVYTWQVVACSAPGVCTTQAVTVTVPAPGGAPASPPVCTPSGVTSPTPLTSAGGTIALNANCVPSAGLTYTWTRTAPTAGAPTNSTTANPSDTLAANTGASGVVVYTWQVVACSAPGVCATKTVSVTVPAAGGGGSSGIDCSSQGFLHTRFIDIGWPASGSSWNTIALGGFGQNDALVIKFTPPPGSASLVNQAGSISMAEYGDPLTGRYAVLSTSACDFNGTGGAYTVPALQVNSTISWSLQVGRKDSGAVVQLNPGTPYYLNLKNRASNGVTPTCSSGSCNMIINWLKPPGS